MGWVLGQKPYVTGFLGWGGASMGISISRGFRNRAK